MEATSNIPPMISLIQLRASEDEVMADRSSNLFTIIRTLSPLHLAVGNAFYKVPPNKLLFIGPGTRIKLINPGREAGYRISFTDRFFDRSNKDAALLYSRLFFDHEVEMHIVDAVRSLEEVRQMLHFRKPLFAEKSITLYHAALKNHIESLLLEGLLGLPDIVTEVNGAMRPDRSLVNSFIVMLHRDYKINTNVTCYASALHVTARKLSKACHEIFGHSAKQVISETITRRAVAYIQHTNLSISQVAFEMGFSDESNFRRFIKKHTGKTARAFRTNDH